MSALEPHDVHRTPADEAGLHPSGWVPLTDDWEVTALPLVDLLIDDAVVFARLTYRDALRAAAALGGELIHPEHVELLHLMATRGEAVEVPAYTGTPQAEKTLEHSLRHDSACIAVLAARGWRAEAPRPTANIGKHWVSGAPPGRSWLMGWWVDDVSRYGSSRRGPGFIQGRPAPGSPGPHGDSHHDDGTTTMLVRRRRSAQTGEVSALVGQGVGAIESAARAAAAWLASVLGGDGPREDQDMGSKDEKPARRTIRRGDVGRDVAAWQSIIGVTPDGAFGASTEAATRAWQEAHGLVADGVVGRRSWEAAGERYATPMTSVDPRAPACMAALRDANAAWPTRRKASDGIMGDAAHQARPSDHNIGLAVDITHDPESGCDAGELAHMAITDARVTYVIWDRRIYSRARAAEGWRTYTGSNPHTKHVHISVRADARDDASPWPWAPR